jgi:UMF1 family MFS transporter
VAATALLYFVRSGDVLMGALIFILAQLGFSGAIIFYDSLLPHIAPPEDIDRISSRGYAMGYAGGGLLLAVNLWMIQTAPAGQVEHITRLVFLTVAAWWLIFTLPLAFFVPEPARRVLPHELRYNPVQASLGRLRNTFSEIGKYRELSKFIFAFWLYNNGIGTIITMATAYGTELGFAQTTLIGTLLMVQFVAIPFSLLFGWLAKRLGVKQSILLSIAIYSLIAIAGYFLTQEWHFWALGFAVATVQGGSQALSRSLFGRLAPPSRSAEFFSFFSISEKIAGAAGPLVFALVGRWMGGSRLSIVSLILFFIAGGLLLSRVNVEEGIRVAESEEAGLVSQAVPLAGAD